MARPDIISAFEFQAGWCEALGSPFTAALMGRMAESLARGGPLADLLEPWAGDPVAAALGLRVAGALHRRVLLGSDAALAAAYPTPERDGDAEAAWRAGEALIAREGAAFGAELDSPPQTNETRRAIGLFPGLLVLAERFALPMELFELGSSAGLNLLMDRFAYRNTVWRAGDGPVTIDGEWGGPAPPLARMPEVSARSGCDQNPLYPGDVADRLRLRSFVWADQFDRLARLEAAMDLAVQQGVKVERADAGRWLPEQLARRTPGRLAVVFHSVFWQYPPEETRAALRGTLERAGAAASEASPLAWLRCEPAEGAEGSRPGGHQVQLTVWPGGEAKVLADVDPHGRWIDWRG
jgi:hypothetical protein